MSGWRAARPAFASETLFVQPGDAGVGDIGPAVVDDERMAAVGEVEEFGGGVGVLVLLQGGLGDRLGDGVVLTAGDEQQWTAVVVARVDLGFGVGAEVGGGGLEDGSAG